MNILTIRTFLNHKPHKRLLLPNSRRLISLDSKISDPYYILGVDRETSFPEIKKKYFILAKKYHPDLNPNNEVNYHY